MSKRLRFSYQSRIQDSRVKVCTESDFLAMLDSKEIQTVCDQIMLEYKDGQPDHDAIGSLKRRLPVITPHASEFTDGKRSNGSAVPSGLVMLDIDHVQNPRTWWSGIDMSKLQPKTHGIYFIAVTPSGHGLRIIGELQSGENIAQGQARLAQLFGFADFDACTKDLARASYMMPRSYVLYLDIQGFYFDASKQTQITEKYKANDVSEPALALPFQETNVSASDLMYGDLTYKEICDRLILFHGGEPKVGERNNLFFSLAIDMRYLCDFDGAKLLSVLPDFGLSLDERISTVRQALVRPRRGSLPLILERALAECKSEHSIEATSDDNLNSPQAGQIPVLPRVLDIMCRKLPLEYRPAMIISSLPVLGALATSVRFDYLDGQEQSFSFFSCVSAPAATGKSFIRKPINLLLTPIDEQDAVEREREQQYKEALRKSKNSKNQPEDPHACPRNNGINISVAALLKLMTYSGGKHLIAIGEEIDTLLKSERAGVWSQKSDIYRLAFDNSYYGQQYMSENSFSAHVPVYYNLLITGTPNGVKRFFSDVENGLVTRVCFATLPDMFATGIPKFDSFSDDECEYIVSHARRLTEQSGKIECKKISTAFADWQESKRKESEESGDRTLDVLRRRCGVIGFRAAMLAYVMNNYRLADKSVQFGLWVADYVLSKQMELFKPEFDKIYREYDDMRGKVKGAVANLLQLLPAEFSVGDLIALRIKHGQSSNVATVLSRWVQSGKVVKTGGKSYRKV